MEVAGKFVDGLFDEEILVRHALKSAWSAIVKASFRCQSANSGTQPIPFKADSQ